jgi:hypothetical protein
MSIARTCSMRKVVSGLSHDPDYVLVSSPQAINRSKRAGVDRAHFFIGGADE